MKYAGVDISKESFDGYCSDLGVRQFSNDELGFKLFKAWVGPSVHVVMEASGPYYLRLAHDLNDSGVVVSVVNPLVIRRFCQMNLQRAKTDSKDAMSIAQFGEMTKPQAWKPSSEQLQQLAQMQSVIEQLSKQLVGTKNALDSLKQHPGISKKAKAALEKVARAQQDQITELERQVMEQTKQLYSDEFKSLISIPGIGKKTSVLLLLATDGLKRFETAKQLTAYAGLAPRIFQSGKTVNKKPKICKLGMRDLRKSLFMCSLQAIKCNKACKDLYERLRQNGKAAKVALIAVCHKLLKQAFAIVKSKTEFNTEFSLGLI